MLSELVGGGPGGRLHRVITATHDGELVDLLRDTYAPFHLTDSLGADGLVFDYRLKHGPATTRNAIALLRLSGAPAGVVNRALQRAAQLDAERTRGSTWRQRNQTTRPSDRCLDWRSLVEPDDDILQQEIGRSEDQEFRSGAKLRP